MPGILESLAKRQAAQERFPFLIQSFIEDMNAIGQYGHEKYGEFSFHARAAKGDSSRGDHPRTTPEAIAEHAKEHFAMHLRGELHDHFGTRRHQLAAVAFNAMMEYFFAGLADEGSVKRRFDRSEITPSFSAHPDEVKEIK